MLRSLLLASLVFGPLPGGALAQTACGPRGCPPKAAPRPASGGPVVRVTHRVGGAVSRGSATLVAHDASSSYFVTCAHVFDDGEGSTEVASAEIGRRAARLVDLDRPNDLALLQTTRCRTTPAAYDAQASVAGELTACGYGPRGDLRCVRGPLVGYATPTGASSPSLRLRGAVRPGDSGGPVFDARRRLVGVVWGQRGGETYAVFGAPLRRILSRFVGGGRLAPVPRTPAQKPVVADDDWRPGIEARLGAVESGLGRLRDAPPALTREDAERFATRQDLNAASSRWETGLGRVEERLGGLAGRAAAAARDAVAPPSGWSATLLAGVGVGGPVGAALLAGQLLLRRRRRRRRRAAGHEARGDRVVAVDSPPPAQRIVPETHYVAYERDEFARAHQWASEQLARKFPGSVEMLTSLDSLIRQRLAGEPDGGASR